MMRLSEELIGGLPEDEPFTFFVPTEEAIKHLQKQLQVCARTIVIQNMFLPVN
jgi:hypothetical protein